MAEEAGFWGNIFDNLGKGWDSMKEHPERTSIALDTIGRSLAPENPFAGVGTALGKSSLAAKAETSGRKESQDMFQQLLRALTPGDKPGPTSLTAALGKDGGGIDYKVSGLQGLEESTKMPGIETPKILTEDDFATAFGEGGGY